MESGNFKVAYKRIAGKRKHLLPLTATVEITQRCNFECKFCYIDSKVRNKRDFPLGKLKQILEQLHNLGIFRIILLGGEPFIRKDFLEIYTFLKNKGFLITLFTNASLLTDRIVNHIANHPLLNIIVSMYGASNYTYREITEASNSFKNFKNGIKLLSKYNVPFTFNILVNKLNEKEIPEMERFAKELKIPFRKTTTIAPGINGNISPCILESKRVHKKGEFFNKKFCSGIIFINNSGNLNFCLFNRQNPYDLEKVNILEAWRQKQRDKIKFRCPLG